MDISPLHASSPMQLYTWLVCNDQWRLNDVDPSDTNDTNLISCNFISQGLFCEQMHVLPRHVIISALDNSRMAFITMSISTSNEAMLTNVLQLESFS